MNIMLVIYNIYNFSFLVLAHKRKAAQARVRSIQKSEESKKERKKKSGEEERGSTVSEVVTSTSVESPESIKAAIHKEEVLFVKRVFPHIISLSEEDLGLNL